MSRYRFAVPVLLGAAFMLVFGSLNESLAVTVRKLENSLSSSSDPVFNDSLSITKKTAKKPKVASKKNKNNKITKVSRKKKRAPLDLSGVPPVTGPGTGEVIGEVVNNPPKINLPQGPVGGIGEVEYLVVPLDTTPVPIPGALPLFATGLAGFGYLAHRRKKASRG